MSLISILSVVAQSKRISAHFFLLSIMLLASCKNDPAPEKPSTTASAEKPTDLEKPTEVATQEVAIEPGYLELQFNDLSIFVESIDADWDGKYQQGNDTVYFVHGDTASLDLFIGEWFWDKKFHVRSNEYNPIKLWVKSVQHTAVSSNLILEVPFCVLNGWKEWESDWQEVSLNNGNAFHTTEINLQEISEKIDPMDIRALVSDQCGERWFEEFQEYTSLEEMGFEFFTSQYIFKVELQSNDGGKTIVKHIVFHTPTHC